MVTESQTIGWFLDPVVAKFGIQDDYPWLMGDFITLVTGGRYRSLHDITRFLVLIYLKSEPVVSTIVYLFYHLAASPVEILKLRDEIKSLAVPPDVANLPTLHHLNALIYETLRLHPPIPSGGLRNTPTSGIKVGETYIPGNTTVLTPHYSLGRRKLSLTRWCFHY